MLPLLIADAIPENGELQLEGDEARHAISALRVQVGERLLVTDGKGSRAEVEVIEISKKNLVAKIFEREVIAYPRTKLVVVQALTKGDRARETIEMLTEGGVTQIIPWRAARSIGSSVEKWQQWGREATKQSRRSWFPEILHLHGTEEICGRIAAASSALMFHEAGAQRISDVIDGKEHDEILLIIGPEGGITELEAKAFLAAGARSVLMGNPVFRSAHAGLAALAAIQTGYRIW